jgi:hypothetical protein
MMIRTRHKVLFLLLAAVFSLLASGCTAQPDTVMVEMRDGARLATDIHLPEGDGPFPTVLSRTPYGRGMMHPELQRLHEAGFAIVMQDVRNTGESDHFEDIPLFAADAWGDQQDGYDTVEWIAEQDWSNGRVGTWGISAPGITQTLVAGSGPPHLEAQHIGLACSDLFGQAIFQGNGYRQQLADTWITGVTGRLDYVKGWFYEHRGSAEVRSTYDITKAAGQAHAPALHWGGWYDIFGQGTIDAFAALQYHGGEGARGNQRLIMGPWPHGIANHNDEVQYPHEALLPPGMDVIEWMRWWLDPAGDEPTYIPPEWPPVAYFTMGAWDEPDAPGNEWRFSQHWPIPATDTALYLRDAGGLSPEPPGESHAITYLFDPENPVPTIGGANLFLPKGPMDQREVEPRDDVILFETEVLEEPIEVTGRVTARLWVSSDAPDTDFTAKLTDVYPDGRSLLVCDGIARVRYRNGFETEDLLEPGEVVEVEVDLWSTSLIFNAGHRIRLAVSSSNYPRFAANPNNGTDQGPPRTATNAVYFGPERPSALILPVVE